MIDLRTISLSLQSSVDLGRIFRTCFGLEVKMLINIVHLGLTLRVCLTICGSLRDKVGTFYLNSTNKYRSITIYIKVSIDNAALYS